MKKFRQVFVEITNVCNLSCSFCPKHNRPPRFMAFDEFKHILDQITPLTRAISLHLMGEPLLHPDFDKICTACNERGLQIYLTTNGTLLKKHLSLFKSGIVKRISVSLHSFEANQNKLTLNDYLTDIFNCAKQITRTEHTFVELRLWNEQADSVQTLAKNSLNQEIIDFACRFFNTKIEWDGKTNQFLTNSVYFCPDTAFDWPDEATPLKEAKKLCLALTTHFGVLVDGTVVACCLDNQGKLSLGNAFNQPIAQLLQSERALKIIEGFKNKTAVEPLCKTCGFANKFSK